MAAVQVETPDLPRLKLDSIIGFSGKVNQGLLKHPDGKHVLYPLGSTVVIKNLETGEQSFLKGHTNFITCLSVSPSGKFVASGQCTHMGYQADIILWDFESRQLLNRFVLHKVQVQALAFSPSDKYLASLGGQDDNTVVIWDLTKRAALCGLPASKDSAGFTHCLQYMHNTDYGFVTGGNGTLRVWELNAESRKIRPTDVALGNIKRVVDCVTVDTNDEFMYCGTTTGDVLQVDLKTKLFKMSGPKTLFSNGIHSIALVNQDSAIIGSGDGHVAMLRLDKLAVTHSAKISGTVTSLAINTSTSFWAGTSHSDIYGVSLPDFTPVLQSTGHDAPVNDVCFPGNTSELFATAAGSEIRVWNSNSRQELLRINIPNLEVKTIVFKKDGSSIISGWNDGKIRAFGPQSGRLQYEIHDAHKKCVTALNVTNVYNEEGDFKIISGGEDGQVRIWRVTRDVQTLEETLKEHKGTITGIDIRHNDQECVSSSSDGSCIIWDLNRFVRNQVMFASSLFRGVKYFPDESQLITTGTDRKVAYWEAFDGSLIREIEASQTDALNGLDMSKDGKYFVVGGKDKLVKVYLYEEGETVFLGVGHSTEITKIRISPDQKKIVSVGSDGSIFTWSTPF